MTKRLNSLKKFTEEKPLSRSFLFLFRSLLYNYCSLGVRWVFASSSQVLRKFFVIIRYCSSVVSRVLPSCFSVVVICCNVFFFRFSSAFLPLFFRLSCAYFRLSCAILCFSNISVSPEKEYVRL